MGNLYDGATDSRQLAEPSLPPGSLFRKRYRALMPEEIALHDAIKEKADELAALINRVPQHMGDGASPPIDNLDRLAVNRGANVTLALRHLEDAVYRAVKALTT